MNFHRINMRDRRRFEQVARWAYGAIFGVVTREVSIKAIESILAMLKREKEPVQGKQAA